ncbi:MAG: glycosyltransferase [Lachnoclostridium sp.]
MKDEEIVLGHVGAFYAVKNHDFIIDVFNELYRNNRNYVLWLVGDGELRFEIEQKVAKLGISDRVHFWGNRKDVSELLQAMDQFILPSFHEGFNIAAVEAQCAGLKCFVSAQCTGLKCFEFIPLEAGKERWAERINSSGTMLDREEGYSFIKDAQFDIRDATKDLERRYLEYARK